MNSRSALAGALLAWSLSLGALAQSPAPRSTPEAERPWRRTSQRSADEPPSAASSVRGAAADDQTTLQPLDAPRRPTARLPQTTSDLPGEQGQVWREYDLSSYTLRTTESNRPEQAIVDWILRETGYEVWFGETFAALNATPRLLRVYHTPEIQAVVADIVDRFADPQSQSQAFGIRVMTIGHPNWRAKAQSMLRPLPVQTQGIQAWLLEKEDAAALLAELRKRSDFREHSSPQLLVWHGQSTTVAAGRPRSYKRDAVARPGAWPAFEEQVAQFDEGFSLELSPLVALDGRSIDAVIKCNIDQLERLVPVMLDVPSPVAPSQRTKIEVPQVSHMRFHERFRWPSDQVLVVGLGVVATPVPSEPGGLKLALGALTAPPRADLVVFVDSRGTVDEKQREPNVAGRPTRNYGGRY
jgi:hypothetical protein